MVVPRLERAESGQVAYWHDADLRRAHRIVVAFSERAGGMSAPPYESLNLAGHVGDNPFAVDENRMRFMRAITLGPQRGRLVTAEQVHGDHVTVVGVSDAGRGAFAAIEPAPVAQTDALVTSEPELPLMLLFADCVPVVLVAPDVRAVGVVHAGWKGAFAAIPAKAAKALVDTYGADPDEMLAYIGPHIGGCCYEVDDELMSHFANTFVTVSRAESGRHLDLSVAVSESLTGAGVRSSNVCRLGSCTSDSTDRFFSYRAEHGVTGRHAAVACILEMERPDR